MGLFTKDMRVPCPNCGQAVLGTVPRIGHTSGQTRCDSCNTVLGVVSTGGNVVVFER